MKKFFAMAAVAALMLTGCVNNEMFEDAEPAEIVMQAVNKVPNKAIVEGATFSGDFKVFGFFSEDDFTSTQQFGMYDVECTKVGDVYKNSTTSYYWPMSGKVGFYAVAPASIAPTVSWADGLTLTNYNVNTAAAKVTDVMFAYNWGAKGSSALKMTFYHALSQVLVKVKTNADYANATLTVKSVSFTNVDVVATCNYEESSTANQEANPSITWTGNTDYDATEEYYATESAAVTDSAVAYGAGILTIPQTMGANAKISIAYALTQNGKTVVGTVSKPITEAWVAGKRYIYTLNFKLDEITFDPDVVNTGWVDVNVDAITIE